MGDEGRCGSLTSRRGCVARYFYFFLFYFFKNIFYTLYLSLDEEFKLSKLILILIVNHFVVITMLCLENVYLVGM